jgi:AcrR family transcriptional regulator
MADYADRKPGKPGPRKDGREALVTIMLETATLVPAEEFTMRGLAKATGVSPQTPLDVFGKLDGVYAAVAERTLEALIERLDFVERSGQAEDALEAAAHEYLTFGLEDSSRWQKLHSPVLWKAVERWKQQEANRKDRSEPLRDEYTECSWGKARRAEDPGFYPFEVVQALRLKAFERFTDAARRAKCRHPGDAAHAVTSLVDGILWQVHFERVWHVPDPARPPIGIKRLIRGTVTGWRRLQGAALP